MAEGVHHTFSKRVKDKKMFFSLQNNKRLTLQLFFYLLFKHKIRILPFIYFYMFFAATLHLKNLHSFVSYYKKNWRMIIDFLFYLFLKNRNFLIRVSPYFHLKIIYECALIFSLKKSLKTQRSVSSFRDFL